MPNIASVGRSFPSLSDSGKPAFSFYGKILSFLLFVCLMCNSNHLPTIPLWGEIRPTVVKSCLDLSGGGISYSGFTYLSCGAYRGAGGILLGGFLGNGPG